MGAEKAALEALREIYTANASSFPPNTLVLVKESLVAKEQYKVLFTHRLSIPPSLPTSRPATFYYLGPPADPSIPPSILPSRFPTSPFISQKEVKNVMKFAALRQQEVKTLGADALEDSLAYDQKAILETNLDYITKSLGRTF